MDKAKLLITDNAFILSAKGMAAVEKSFSTDDECFKLIADEVAKLKKAHITCLLSGSHLVSHSRTVHYTHAEPFAADDKVLQLLLENATHTFMEERKGDKLEIIQKEAIGIALNGYPVSELKKQKASDLTVTVYFAAVSAAYYQKLRNALGKQCERASFASFPWHQAMQVEKLASVSDFIICAVYERSTDLSVKRDGSFFETATIPLGTGHARESAEKGLSEGFQKTLGKAMEGALTQLCDGLSLPPKVFLLAAQQYQEAFSASFKGASYHSICFSENGFEVTNMSSILTA